MMKMSKRKLRFGILGTVLLLIPACALLLIYGNPQWCRWIYIYQSWVKDEIPYTPRDFTGIWRTWHKNGRLASKATRVDGKMHGPFQMWYPSGALWRDRNYDHGTPIA